MVNASILPDDLPMLESLDHIPDHLSQAVDDLIVNLDMSVMLQVRGIPDTMLVQCYLCYLVYSTFRPQEM